MKNLSILLIITVIINTFYFPLKASAQEADKLLLRGSIETKIDEGKKINITPETLLSSDFSLAGDYFSAFISNEDAQKLGVPNGSKLLGNVSKISQEKSLGRDAKITIDIDQILFPDGDTVAVDAQLESSNPENTIKHFSKEAAYNVGTVTASSLVGAVDVMSYTGGIPAALATNGMTVGIGAGIGLGFGLYGAMKQKGESTVNSGFASTTFKLKEDFSFLEPLPLMSQNLDLFSQETFGIDITVFDIQKFKSVTFGDFLTIDLNVINNSARELFIGDFVLVSDKEAIPVFNNALITGAESWKTVPMQESGTYKLAFSLNKFHKDNDYKLQLFDPISDKLIVNLDININQHL